MGDGGAGGGAGDAGAGYGGGYGDPGYGYGDVTSGMGDYGIGAYGSGYAGPAGYGSGYGGGPGSAQYAGVSDLARASMSPAPAPAPAPATAPSGPQFTHPALGPATTQAPQVERNPLLNMTRSPLGMTSNEWGTLLRQVYEGKF